MKKRRIIRRICVISASLLFLCAVFFVFSFFTARGYRMTPYLHGYTEISDGIWLDDTASADPEDVIYIILSARERVSDFFGELHSSPMILVTSDEKKLARIGAASDTMTFSVGNVYSYVSLCIPGLDIDTAAHELTHAETHHRLYRGKISRGRTVPVWFDEGIAMQNDHGARYGYGSLWKYTDGGKAEVDFSKLSDPDYFYRSDEETVHFNYIVSKYELWLWIEENGRDALFALLDSVADGGDFTELYSDGVKSGEKNNFRNRLN